MNRRSFAKRAAGFLAALGLGGTAKASVGLDRPYYGCDVARFGDDMTVVHKVVAIGVPKGKDPRDRIGHLRWAWEACPGWLQSNAGITISESTNPHRDFDVVVKVQERRAWS